MREIGNHEAIEIMTRCREEIRSLRTTIAHLEPKAEAYDNMTIILKLLGRQGIAMGEDLIYILDKRIRELQPKPITSFSE